MVRMRSKAHSQEFMTAFGPVRRFLIIIGQLPFQIQKRVRMKEQFSKYDHILIDDCKL